MNISELLARNARKFPNKVGFISEPDRLTYKEVDEKVTRLAHALKTCGIMPGDKVILFSPNTIEFVYSYFAVQTTGGNHCTDQRKTVYRRIEIYHRT